MSGNNTELAPTRSGAKIYCAIIIKSVLWGPPIGWVIILSLASVYDPLRPQLSTFSVVLIFGLPFSYLLGGVQAAIGGLAVAEYHSRRGHVPVLYALLVGILLSVVAMFVVREGLTNNRQPSVLSAFAVVVAVHVIPALACWHLTKRYWKSPSR